MDKFDLNKFDQEEKALEIRYLLAKYLRYWPYYLLFTLNFLVGTYIFHRYTVDEYSVSGTMIIKGNNKPETKILDRSAIFSTPQSLENDILMLTSKNLAREALRKVHFDVEYWAKTKIKPIELYDRSPVRIEVDWNHMQLPDTPIQLEILSDRTFRLGPEEPGIFDLNPVIAQGDENLFNREFEFGETIITSKSKFTVFLVNPGKVGDVIIFRLRNPAVLEEILAGSVAVNIVNWQASVLEIRMNTRVAEKGRDYINALMESYLDYELKEKNRTSENTLRFIEEQLKYLEDSLRKKERELQAFKIENRLVNVSSEFSGLLGKMDRLEEQYQELDFQQSYFISIQKYVEEKAKDFTQVIAPSVIGIPDPLLNGLIQTLVTLSQDRRKLLVSVNENHPEVIKIDVQMNKVQEALFENVQNLIANTDLKKRNLKKEMEGSEALFRQFPDSESRYAAINREYVLRENLYTYLLEKRAEIGIAKASNISDNSILDYARRGKIIFPNKSQNYLIAIALGLFLPFGFFVGKDLFDNRIKDQRQLKKHFMIPQLSVIGLNKYDTNLVVLEHPRSAVSESFRSLRSAINYLRAEKNTKKILITSSVSGEGKTFTSLNLASVMALGGKKTVVVGGDLRRPKLASYFEMKEKNGLSQLLIGNASEEEIIQATPHENLFLVPSGPIPPNPAELLQSDRMKNFISYLEQHFDIIILDTPPLGLVSETVDLMRMFDINLYVVRQNYTLKNHLVMINDLFNNKQVNNVYGIFNGIEDSGYYYEGYNYGYGNTYLYAQDNKYSSNYYEEESGKKLKVRKKKRKE